jgi:hypothetical protein
MKNLNPDQPYEFVGSFLGYRLFTFHATGNEGQKIVSGIDARRDDTGKGVIDWQASPLHLLDADGFLTALDHGKMAPAL